MLRDRSRFDETGNPWEDRAAAIGQLHLEYGQEIDAETLYTLRRTAELAGAPRPPFYAWPCNATIIRDARAAFGDRLTDEARYIVGQRIRQAHGAQYERPGACSLRSDQEAVITEELTRCALAAWEQAYGLDGLPRMDAMRAALAAVVPYAIAKEMRRRELEQPPAPEPEQYKVTLWSTIRVIFGDWRTAALFSAMIVMALASGALEIYQTSN